MREVGDALPYNVRFTALPSKKKLFTLTFYLLPPRPTA